MRKSQKRMISIALCAISICSLALPLCSCKEDRAVEYDSERDALAIGVDSLQGNFNPFYAKASGDKAVVEQTQAPLITMGADGYPLATEDEATVARSFQQTTYNALGEETKEPLQATTTRYEFVIKDEAVFSDGTPITIKDVLFNLYVYLDPAYTGSNTLRDLDICGLDAYRLQTTGVADESAFSIYAQTQVTNIINYLQNQDRYTDGAEMETSVAFVKEVILDLQYQTKMLFLH